ncbi:MAG: phosphoenolpyruvate--protein phosphotransferase [Treponema sp.]|jgi:phosphotransferase system enzyme I (PtsI)|nr:phosphoenolpyruvate--protein phosphotransferase [Treponema sp.]
MKRFSGIPISPGVAYGEALRYVDNGFPEIPRYSLTEGRIGGELARLDAAFGAAAAEARDIHERAEREMGKGQAAIFEAHLLMLEDPFFMEQITASLKKTGQNAEWVLWETARELMRKMTASADPVFRERAADISDVSKRILDKLLGIEKPSLADLDRDIILAAHDLLPSEVLGMNKSRVKGIVMDMGGQTSHTAILARAFNIPAVLGLSTITKEVKNGDTLMVDGGSGEVILNPQKRDITHYQKADIQYRKKQDEFLGFRDLPSETLDGCGVTVKANIELPEEAEGARSAGAGGIGLYRSEFLFLTPGKAAEEEAQYEAYRRVLEAMGGLPVTIRTVDIGGDKILPDFTAASEKNPLLGWRAIRFSLALPELFKTQLRAILRASVNGNVRIMFPLISGIEELEKALRLLDEARGECRKRGLPFADNIEVGTMIEVPSAAMTADILVKKSDFFSIGTNDLIQYSLAVDRGNEKVNYLAQPCHPAVLRFLKTTIDAAHEGGIKAAMCGEMAGDPGSTALLLGLGLDELSMAAPAIPRIKRIIRGVSLRDCRVLAEKALEGVSCAGNAALLKSWMAEHFPTG